MSFAERAALAATRRERRTRERIARLDMSIFLHAASRIRSPNSRWSRTYTHGNASSPLFPRAVRGAELHPRGRTLPRGAAIADARHQGARGGDGWRAVPPRARQYAPLRARANAQALSGAGIQPRR